jgi:hypothetical protein
MQTLVTEINPCNTILGVPLDGVAQTGCVFVLASLHMRREENQKNLPKKPAVCQMY